MKPFAAYLRTSTDDHQSPTDSAAWQLRLAKQLISDVEGEIVVTYHDVDQSRSLPWERRPRAAQLLQDLRSKDRVWSDLVIAEPQRAFAGNQFGLVFPVLVHYGVSLWVPEVGGRVDPESEAHDLLMSLFGGLAKAERNRIRHRVRAAMAAHASAGRWLGGRPPFGYRFADAGPHPNPEKAASGQRLHQLEEDADNAPTVRRIFELYVNGGHGYKTIAAILTAEGVPSPSAADPARNPHRPGHAWAGSAVRAILSNPRYIGRHVYGRQKRQERLLDPDHPALGHGTTMAWQPREAWVIAETATHPALVTEELWERAQLTMQGGGRRATSSRGESSGPRRSAFGRYALVGILRCEHCGRRMQGNHSRGLAFYRCRLTLTDYAVPPEGHPKSLAVREDRILPVLDQWLTGLLAADRIDEVAAQIVEADRTNACRLPELDAAHRAMAEAHRKINRYVAGLEAGMDPALVADRTRVAQAEIARAQAVLDGEPAQPSPLTLGEVLEVLEAVRTVPELLRAADMAVRADLYQALGLDMTYRRTDGAEFIHVSASITPVDLERVGGGT